MEDVWFIYVPASFREAPTEDLRILSRGFHFSLRRGMSLQQFKGVFKIYIGE
jgi:hypothetical protein